MVSVGEINISYVMKYYKDTNIVDNYLNSIGLDKNQSAKMKKHITSEKVIEDSIKKWKIMIEKTKKKKIDGGRKRKTKKHRRKKRGKRKTQKVQRGGNGILNIFIYYDWYYRYFCRTRICVINLLRCRRCLFR